MPEVNKKESGASTAPFKPILSEWSESKSKDNTEKYRRIIKAGEAFFSPESKEIPHLKMAPETPVVKPIRKGLFVEGIEIVCRCGEKIVVRFDFEENAELR